MCNFERSAGSLCVSVSLPAKQAQKECLPHGIIVRTKVINNNYKALTTVLGHDKQEAMNVTKSQGRDWGQIAWYKSQRCYLLPA